MENITEKESIENENTKDGINDNKEEIERLLKQISELKSESLQFSQQRAKMKDLFLQKETEELKLKEEKEELERELDEKRCQITVLTMEWESERSWNRQEMNSLQQLLNETLEEDSRREEKIKKLKQRFEQQENEMSLLKAEISDKNLLAAPGTILSMFAKKVASQLGASDSSSAHESLDESMRKAKESTELLKSLLVPLEEEIVSLKKKLRDTDAELQKYQQTPSNSPMKSVVQPEAGATKTPSIGEGSIESIEQASTEGSSSTPSVRKGCEMCSNYEAQLVQAEARIKDLEKQVHTLGRCKEELAKETVFRKQMEEKWTEKKEEHKSQVLELQERLKTAEETLVNVKQTYNTAYSDISRQFSILADERKATQERLDRLQLENENLVGKYNAHSAELQNETINLPDNVEALQEMWLKQSESLIRARVGQENCEQLIKNIEVKYEVAKKKISQLGDQVNQLRDEINAKNTALETKDSKMKQQDEKLLSLKSELKSTKQKLNTALSEKRQLEDSEMELKNRLVSLQTGLENGEAVQKDFVLLSQNLQKELEHLRVQNNVLRWEYEEDVTECRGCEQSFSSINKSKGNCRHCGRVFCSTCLSHKVVSGASKRESPVCTVCHTLLDHHTPPYFSTEPPK